MFSETWLGFVEDEMMYEDFISFSTGYVSSPWDSSNPDPYEYHRTHNWPSPFQPSYEITEVLPLGRKIITEKITRYKVYNITKRAAVAKKLDSLRGVKDNIMKSFQRNSGKLSESKIKSENSDDSDLVTQAIKQYIVDNRWKQMKIKADLGDSKYNHIEANYEKFLRLRHIKNFYSIPIFNRRKYIVTQMKIKQLKKFYPYLYRKKRMQNKWKQYLKNEKDYDQKLKAEKQRILTEMQQKGIAGSLKKRKKIKLCTLTLRDMLDMTHNNQIGPTGLRKIAKNFRRKCHICHQIVYMRYHLCPAKFWGVDEDWFKPSFETEKEDPSYLPIINQFPMYFLKYFDLFSKYSSKKTRSDYLMRILHANELYPYNDGIKREKRIRKTAQHFSPVKKHHPPPKLHRLPEKIGLIKLDESEEKTAPIVQHITQFSLKLLEGKKVVFKRPRRYYYNWDWMLMAKGNQEEESDLKNKNDQHLVKDTNRVDVPDIINSHMTSDTSVLSSISSIEQTLTEDSVIPGVPSATIKAWRSRMEYLKTKKHLGIQCPSENYTRKAKKNIASNLGQELKLISINNIRKSKSQKRQTHKPKTFCRNNKTKILGYWRKNSIGDKTTFKPHTDDLPSRSMPFKEKNIAYMSSKDNNANSKLNHFSRKKSLEELMPVQILFSKINSKEQTQVFIPSRVPFLSNLQLGYDYEKGNYPNPPSIRSPKSMIVQLVDSKPTKFFFKPNFELVFDENSNISKLPEKQLIYPGHTPTISGYTMPLSSIKSLDQLIPKTSTKYILKPNIEYLLKVQPVNEFENIYNSTKFSKNNIYAPNPLYSISDCDKTIIVNHYIEPEKRSNKVLLKEIMHFGDSVKTITSTFSRGASNDDLKPTLPSCKDGSSNHSITTLPRSELTIQLPPIKVSVEKVDENRRLISPKKSEKKKTDKKLFPVDIFGNGHSLIDVFDDEYIETVPEENDKVKSNFKFHNQENQIGNFNENQKTTKNRWAIQNFPLIKESKHECKCYINSTKQPSFCKNSLPVSSTILKDKILHSSNESLKTTFSDPVIEIEDSKHGEPSQCTQLNNMNEESVEKMTFECIYKKWVKWLMLSPEEENVYRKEKLSQKISEAVEDLDKTPHPLIVKGSFRSRSPLILAAMGKTTLAAKYFTFKETARLNGVHLFNKYLMERATSPKLVVELQPRSFLLKNLPKPDPIYKC